MNTKTWLRTFPIGFALVTAVSCGAPMGAEETEDVGQIGISLTSVPSDGTCIRFTTTAGTRSFQQSFDALADSPLTAALHGLPYNQTLNIFAEAFAGTCSALSSASLATYLSDIQATILAPGETKNIAFTLRPTGNVNGTADFLFLTMTPTSKAFGNVVIGQQGAPFSFTVTNIGMVPTSTLATSLVDFPGGSTSTQFTISSNTCTGPLPAGERCTVQVRLSPTSAGSKNATLQVTGMTGGTVNATLSGVGWNPARLTITPPTINLGNVLLGTPSFFRYGDFAIFNAGDEPTSVPSATLDQTGTDFILSPCSSVLAGHQSCHVLVGFVPTILGAESATLNVTSSPGGNVTGTITGTGTSPFTLSPASADLGSAPVGGRGATQTFTLRNTGLQASTALTISSTPDFTITADACSTRTLAANATCTVTVQLAPTTTGPLNGSLNANASPGWSAQAPLTGSGT